MNGESTSSTGPNGINGGTFKMEDHPLGQNGRKLRVAMSEFLVLRRFLRRPARAPEVATFSTSDQVADEFVCLAVGSGFSGITAAIRLEQRLPEVEFDIFEKNHSVGGTWYENA